MRVYPGTDGTFTLYEDGNDSYDYEKSVFATIPLSWSEKNQTLTIGKTSREFSRYADENGFFRVVWVSPQHGTGVNSTDSADAEVQYVGDPIEVTRSGK